ncbi:MAG TPA: LPXTG cell wall anchor domain-containing protein [Streptomyces sp.]|nr:LPXTG cell wall anchor domain-containing protein [Streptomyces sp.]
MATAAATVLLAAPAAYADAPGDNGTVKVHKVTTSEDDMRNNPHVCEFYLDGFKFDGHQQVSWYIVGKASKGGWGTDHALEGTVTLNADGHERTDDLQLPSGHYKLYWNFDGEHGKAKQKVFKVRCDEGSAPGEDTPGTTPSEGASTTPADDASQPASPAPSAPAAEESSAAAAPSAAPSPNGGSEDLAETGSSAPVGAIAGAAALLLGAGAYLTLRRRNSRARQH